MMYAVAHSSPNAALTFSVAVVRFPDENRLRREAARHRCIHGEGNVCIQRGLDIEQGPELRVPIGGGLIGLGTPGGGGAE